MIIDHDDRVVVELDNRGRASLGKVADGRRLYLMSVNAEGVITLVPAVVMATVAEEVPRG